MYLKKIKMILRKNNMFESVDFKVVTFIRGFDISWVHDIETCIA